MTEHHVYVNPRWIETPNDCQCVVGCTDCGYRDETVTVEHAKLLAIKHLRDARVAHRARRQAAGETP